ncbi:transcriptional regulator [Conservatibacter flavescens]|uniref:Transcriptional regulator n=2 Tax=Conservatibacter flavescens TaxID=28161 RepID=A0A2M8S2W7_9PAST|nr:transcriptional regulator [Conservatibacter flavescens]
MNLTLIDDHDVKQAFASYLWQKRKSAKLSRQALSDISGVPAPTIKKFETTGEISLRQFLKLWLSLDDLKRLYNLTKPNMDKPAPRSIDEVLNERF